MTDELRRAMTKAEGLSSDRQKLIAELILDEINWDDTFQSSSEKLTALAKEALTDYKAGKTKPMDF